MFRSVISLSLISLLSSKNGSIALLHSSPLHPSQAATHFKPLFRQEHRFVPQMFRNDILHLHRMITKIIWSSFFVCHHWQQYIVNFLPSPVFWIFITFIQRFPHSDLKMQAQTVEVGSSFSWLQPLWVNLQSICCYHIHIFVIAQTI